MTIRKKWTYALLIIGCILLLLPMGMTVFQMHRQQKILQTYQREQINTESGDAQHMIEAAQTYNEKLFATGDWEQEGYDKLLNPEGTGMIGTLTIDAIHVHLPIYHGTSDEVLQVGVGHAKGSSLPIGGANTHAVLTGHRGLPGAKLFTRLDELKEDDIFTLSVCGRILHYRIFQIQVLTPEDANIYAMQIWEDEDLVSLITCTPYGINTKRLIVTGERIPAEETVISDRKIRLPGIREMLFTALPFIAVVVMILRWGNHRKYRKKEVDHVDET